MNSSFSSDNSRTTSISRKLFILQYNVHKFKNIVMISFLRDSVIKKFDIIVVQESWINAYTNITHHSLKNNHFLFYSNSIEMKKNLIQVCMFVIKRIFIDDLKYLFRSKNVMIVQIRLHETHYLHLHNVYNESNILSFFVLQNLRFVLLKSSSDKHFKDHIIMKDLNIHHLSWSDSTTRSNSRSLEMLLLMNEFRLQFNLSRETSTYVHFQRSESIIDMCLTTENLNNRILICKTRSDLNHDSNHFFIETILNISINETSFFERFNWDRLNMKKIKSILNYLLFDQSTQHFDATQVDVYIKFVCAAITKVINAFISKFKTSIRVIFDFDETCNLTRTQTNQARRTFQDELVVQKINTKQALHVWKKAKVIKKRIIRKTLRITHRNVVFSVIENAQKTWKLVKWIKNRSTSFKFIISFLRRSNDIMILIKKAKTQCLIDFFFSSSVAVNLDDIIEKTAYSKSIDFFEIIENEINQTIVKIASNIASKKNDILNRVIKLAFSHVMFVVKWIFNQSLRLEYCLKHFRKFITIFLRKINKSDYFVFKAYRFIALLNLLDKLMKSIMTIRLSYATKKHNLLLREHFEDRKDIASKHALHYIVEAINSVWVSKKTATMLLLNVIEAFDNVSHLRLLHNLKKRQIKNIYLIWMKSFLSKRYIILKLINHITDRIRTVINVSQKSSMSSILYVFYNANLFDWCINSQADIIATNFIDDINILVVKNSVEENVLSLKTIHVELCMIWAYEHDSLFVSIKYELIHFRRLFASSNSKMILKILDHQIALSFKCKYLDVMMNSQLIWKHHLKHLKKKSINKLSILTILAEFIWKVSIEDLRRIYLIIVLFQFTYCISIWYVLNEKHDFKQKENVALIFMKNIQTRTAQIISNAFRFIVEIVLNVELYLSLIRQQLNMIIYDALLRLIISSTYFFIKSLKVLLNRFFALNQTQHQRMLYAQLSSLQKLKIKYAAIFDKDLDRFELRISFFVILWWKLSIIIIISSTEIAIITHDQIMQKCSHLIIFTDDIDIDNQIKTFAVTIIFSMSRMIFIVMNKKQVYLKLITKITIYSKEIVKLDFVLNVIENHFKDRFIIIFTNCQIAIRVIQCFKKQSDQYLLQILIRRIEHCDREIHIHWISTHVEIFDNEAIDIVVKKIIEWRQSNRDSLIFVIVNSKILISAIRSEIRTRAKTEWIEIWRIIIIERITHRIIKKFIKNVLKKFKRMTRLENAVIVQTRTNKIELRNYLHKIKTIESSRCFCEVRRQTMHHTLLKCSKFDDLRKKMWTNKRETNLMILLDTFELIVKIFKYLFATNELLQFRHLNKAQTNDDDVDLSRETLMKNDW